MPPPPPSSERPHHPPSKRGRAALLFVVVWLVGTAVTLVFAQHKHDPFDALNSRVPAGLIPVVIGVYAALLAAAWMAVPRSRSEFVNEGVWIALMCLGGVFAPHTLCVLIDLCR